MKQQNATRWTAKQDKYINWMANPYRKETKTQIARKLGVNRTTLFRWSQIDGFYEEVDKRIDKYARREEAEIWQAMIANAKKKWGGADRKLFFEMINKYTAKAEVDMKGRLEFINDIMDEVKDETAQPPKTDGSDEVQSPPETGGGAEA